MDLNSLLKGLEDSLQDNPIQRAGEYWAENINPIYDNMNPLAQAIWSANPLTSPAIAMGQMHKYASAGDPVGMAATGLSGIFGPIAARTMRHIRPSSGLEYLGNTKLGLSKTGVASAIPDTAYELPKDREQYLREPPYY